MLPPENSNLKENTLKVNQISNSVKVKKEKESEGSKDTISDRDTGEHVKPKDSNEHKDEPTKENDDKSKGIFGSLKNLFKL